MKASALIRLAVKKHLMTPKQFAENVHTIGDAIKNRGLCGAIRDAATFSADGWSASEEAAKRLHAHIDEAIRGHDWFHAWLKGQVPDIDLKDRDTCIAIQKHRIEWAKRIARQFEQAGD